MLTPRGPDLAQTQPAPSSSSRKSHKRKSLDDEDSDSGREVEKSAKQSAKKAKKDNPKKDPPKTKPGDVGLTMSGESFIELGKQKRASISEFKGVPYLNIREYYGPPGDEKPGKKGIALSREQWNVLKANMDILDRHFNEVGK
ncbi:hypothetical protein ONZ45_g13872 [Pleurotus djamor]|nr:hypothetical protein ONZ45_g13872 [Pleurotus djamor]